MDCSDVPTASKVRPSGPATKATLRTKPSTSKNGDSRVPRRIPDPHYTALAAQCDQRAAIVRDRGVQRPDRVVSLEHRACRPTGDGIPQPDRAVPAGY